MKHQQKSVKDAIQITCHYQKDGIDARELIKQSFHIFAKSCIIKYDEWSLISGGTPCTQK